MALGTTVRRHTMQSFTKAALCTAAAGAMAFTTAAPADAQRYRDRNNDGISAGEVIAGALIIGSRAAGEKAGIAPRARIIAGGVAGVPPRVMGLGPVHACNKVLERAGLTLADMDVIEINEAFAAQVLGCCKQLGLQGDDERLNPNGGAIAVGHPLGASGVRVALTALRQLERTGGRYALVSLCIGVGQGVAMLIERQA